MLSSTRSLPELPPISRRKVQLSVAWARGRSARPRTWIHRWTLPDRAVWLAIGRTADGYLFRFRRFADFDWSAKERRLTCHVRLGTQAKTVRHLLLDQVLPILASDGMTHNGLHGSAVMIEGGAVAFVGETGRGKSTLAASFARAGHPVITDDCVVLKAGRDGLRAVPTYPSLRLWQDAADTVGRGLGPRRRVAEYSAKLRISARSTRAIPFCVEPVPLRCVYVLDRQAPRRSVAIERLSQREAFIQLIRFGFRLDPRQPARLAREMERVADLSGAVPVRRLRMPWRLEALPSVCQAVLNDVRASASSRSQRPSATGTGAS